MPKQSISSSNPTIPWWFNVLAALRTPLIMFIVIPLSFIVDTIIAVRNWWYFTFRRAPHLHNDRVKEVQDAIRQWNKDGRKKKLCTARPGWAGMNTRMPDFKTNCNKINLSKLCDILEVNESQMTIRMEPLADMGQASRVLIPRGLALRCLPEMDDLTIGGLVNGYGLSTMSHRCGTMQENIVSIEIVTSDGELVVATPENEHSDLFYAVPWAHGTLGFMVAVTVRMIRVKPYVRMEYTPCYSLDELDRLASELTDPKNPRNPDFFEATLYSPETSVIQAGYFQESPAGEPVNYINRFWKPWFYRHVETALANGAFSEVIPLRHYYHRHTKSIYWELEDMIPFGNHWLYRYLWGWLGAPKVSLVKMTQGVAVRKATLHKHVCQELFVPKRHLKEMQRLYDACLQVYPLLLYMPRVYKAPKAGGFLRSPDKQDLCPGEDFAIFAELGAYGVPYSVKRGSYWDALGSVRAVEKFGRDTKGYQCMCFDTLQTKEQYMQMFDHTLWLKVREKYRCNDAFPDVYTKVAPEQGVV